ncbi:hypothetical protein DM02DRAFT_615902 [Periconia macrospinosa]|uniref:Secreted protein n=1 Tax=Periconia macrospinosa TaxID=97972 RepID=A0A2V1DJU2_9PLEO|nr:hypothetical protein DM02DRAFT_615902 [Periconia macrospinosa]
MQFITIFAAAAPFIAGVSASCYTSGASWPSGKGDKAALLAAESACDEMIAKGPFTFGTAETRKVCRPLAGDKTKSVHFEIEYQANYSRDVDRALCIKAFSAEINGCNNGGFHEEGNIWWFIADPQAASCK